MSNSYEKLLSNLNSAKLELKSRNDSSLDSCVKYIKDAIIEAGRLNAKYANLSAEYDMSKFMRGSFGPDDWSED